MIGEGDDIEVIGASENNLKHVSVTIPKGRLVVFAGVSGSGKSSLAFDTIARESQRAWRDSYRQLGGTFGSFYDAMVTY